VPSQRKQRDEPTAAELAAIEREWPLIAAELAVVDAEVTIADADGQPTELDVRRLRHAEAAVSELAARPVRRSGRSRRSA
jgi:Family of unknown function (DUF6284)